MNRNILIGLAALILIVLLLGYWWMSAPTVPPGQQSVVTPPPSTNAASSNPTSVPASNTPPGSTPGVPYNHQAEMEREKKVWDFWFMTPIAFYGKVVDQNGTPVEGADALISPSQHLLSGTNGETNDPKYHVLSDDQGLFSIKTHGLGISVMVSKQGYYSLATSNGNFAYVKGAGQLAVYNDPKAPAIFVLRKRGQTEPLIVINGTHVVSTNGAATQMNLATVRDTPVDIQVEAWIHNEGIPPNGNHPYDWRCKITVPGGGLQPRTGGEFDFIAPTDGYQPNDEINILASDPQWRNYAAREYFLKLANGDYARISFSIGTGGYNDFQITSYLNPAPGHRNLEYDPAKQINK